MEANLKVIEGFFTLLLQKHDCVLEGTEEDFQRLCILECLQITVQDAVINQQS